MWAFHWYQNRRPLMTLNQQGCCALTSALARLSCSPFPPLLSLSPFSPFSFPFLLPSLLLLPLDSISCSGGSGEHCKLRIHAVQTYQSLSVCNSGGASVKSTDVERGSHGGRCKDSSSSDEIIQIYRHTSVCLSVCRC